MGVRRRVDLAWQQVISVMCLNCCSMETVIDCRGVHSTPSMSPIGSYHPIQDDSVPQGIRARTAIGVNVRPEGL
jgi:hypothetical protein